MNSWLPCLLPLLLLAPPATPFRPYVTCVGCETFLQCFLTCPVADYPGVNQFGVYIPKFLREITQDPSEQSSSPQRKSLTGLHNTYRNWRPYSPHQYTDYHRRAVRKQAQGPTDHYQRRADGKRGQGPVEHYQRRSDGKQRQGQGLPEDFSKKTNQESLEEVVCIMTGHNEYFDRLFKSFSGRIKQLI